ncbi:MAG: efflux RND transporter periplasmic adaptor subunit [Spirochaetales bacterium]|nr:efflux RND transporter periplasmic adaptor subunit [Spirochaetales bacterium]
MKKKLLIIMIPVGLCLIILGIFLFIPKNHGYRDGLRFTTIERGDVRNSISCTGTINPKGIVEIGTQVSGTILHVYVDYNNRVKKNQVLASLDTTLLEIAVQQAEADLAKATAQYNHDVRNYENNTLLYEKKLISDYDFEEINVAKESSYASKLTAQNNLKKAQSNLSYAIIRSPIDGIVINRNVEEGQTVVASYSTPTLFTIARDLSSMQIDALVDENDIGSIKVNQEVEFTVDAYPDETFKGSVVQVRLQPVTVSNVVNYYVIIDTTNPEHHLLPGMTATIDVIVEEKKDVLFVANIALQIKPTAEMTKEIEKTRSDRMNQQNDKSSGTSDKFLTSEAGRRDTTASTRQRTISNNAEQKGNARLLWFIDERGALRVHPVRTGITDGQKTEISGSPDIKEGLKVISGVNSSSNADTTTNTRDQHMGPPHLF